MSPASLLISAVSLSIVAGPAPVFAELQRIPEQWKNPLPDNFRALDGRNHYLQSETSKFLEMHPNGPRGIDDRTEYGILTILLVQYWNVTYKLGNWKDSKDSKNNGRKSRGALHMIRSNRTGRYLCMDDHSVVYQSKEANRTEQIMDHCVFNNEYSTNNFRETYHRKVNGTKWYIGINNDGSLRCGNVTLKPHKYARFNKLPETDLDEYKPSPKFERQRKPCCPTKRCRKKCRTRQKDPAIRDKPSDADKLDPAGEQPVCRRTYTNWCRKHRRQFFKLKLRDLKRYYNRCIKKNRNKGCKQRHKVRHCKDR